MGGDGMNVQDKVVAVTGRWVGHRACARSWPRPSRRACGGQRHRWRRGEADGRDRGGSDGPRCRSGLGARRPRQGCSRRVRSLGRGRVRPRRRCREQRRVLGQIAPSSTFPTRRCTGSSTSTSGGSCMAPRPSCRYLKTRPEASLVNISSIAGLMASLGNAAYLRGEVRRARASPSASAASASEPRCKVSLVHPGVVKTNLAAGLPSYTEAEHVDAVRRYHANPGVSPSMRQSASPVGSSATGRTC